MSKKTVWLVFDEWGYWGDVVFATREKAVSYLEDIIDYDNSWNYMLEHYLRVGDIDIQEVTVIE